MNTGERWLRFRHRLGDSWADLATVLEIPRHDLDRLDPDDRAWAIRIWLEQRDNLAALPSALMLIGREDLAELIAPTIAAAHDPARSDNSAPPRPRTRRWVAVTGLVVAVAVVAGTVMWQLGILSANDPNSTQPAPTCKPVPASGTAQVTPPRAGGLTFCPIKVDDGKLPITGPFSLAGQILGDLAVAKDLALFVRIDKNTCDTRGNRGSPGIFFIPITVDQIDGTWLHRDDLGGDLAFVTLGRTFEFAITPASVRQSILAARPQWNEDGLTPEMLDGVTFLAKFEIPPGDAPTRKPCRD